MYSLLRTRLFQGSFRAAQAHMRRTPNVRPLTEPTSYHCFKQDNLPPHQITYIGLKFSILQQTYQAALKNTKTPSLLFTLIESAPPTLSLDETLTWLGNQLMFYPVKPVITGHPTRILSNEAMMSLTHITDDLIKLEQNKIAFEDIPAFRAQLSEAIQTWVHTSSVPSTNLTPGEEAEFALFIYKRILATFPEFRQQVIQKFKQTHGGSEAYIASKLNAPIMNAYQSILNWVWADCDGNRNITDKTMSSIIPLQQNAILELYIAKLQSILQKLNKPQHASERKTLQNMHDYFQRCARSISEGIWFDVASSKKTQQRILPRLEKLQAAIKEKSPLESTRAHTIQQELSELHDLISLAGFFGGLKQYMRQTTQLNQRVLNDLLTLLLDEHRDIQALMNNRNYNELEPDEKHTVLRWLRTEPRYFKTLKQAQEQHRFHEETQRELDRLSFVREHTDLFPNYITSDTEDKTNFDEALLLFRFASFLSGTLRIGQIREHALNPIPLCETPKDLKHFATLFKAMLDDTSIRNKIIESGFISYVSGPSDLGKKGGIFVYISLLRAHTEALALLHAYQQTYPELKHVQLRVLLGFGGDMKRRHGSSANELHSTQQGIEAWRVLAATGAYPAFLHRVLGQPSESYLRAEELRQLEAHHWQAFRALNIIEAEATAVYQTFIESQENKDLLVKLTSLPLEKRLNISSRAGAKINFEDPTNVRAIGVTNLYLITGIQWDVFMSAVGLLDLPRGIKQYYPCLFNELTVMKDIIYKLLFTVAVSNFPRAWERIRGENDPKIHATLAHIETSAIRILAQSISYFSPEQQKNAQAYLDKAYKNDYPVHEIALGLMDALGLERLAQETRDLLPHFACVTETVDAYEANPTPETLENAQLALRGYAPIAAGPECIATLTCPARHEALMNPKNPIEETPTPRL
ncbi:MAG: phosphoenolpyruvate carboxylase [Legionellaceae bacterium]|nr:phosphoenolpyruvate carboxylase [Legionellaceae bacterium]